MQIEKSSGIGGAWVNKKELKNGDLVKIKSEATWIDGQNGKQLVAKIRVKGQMEDVNTAINTPTKNALIEAFGTESADWVDKPLTVAVEAGIFAGKRGVMMNLIPEGFTLGEDSGGYIVISKAGKVTPPAEYTRSKASIEEGIDPEDVPF